ncbi:BURP domain-containing protein 3-like [Durio zibethinus]|uniref:BURP domain-containing protein 3-like n=1 Tax=Durio zibethinus TaxID=66656 RepID=A0A6P6AXL0_DURZI|nr:BURP domain-containing protein 3-like [Durio zibethinus]
MVLRSICSVLLLCFLLLTSDHGNAAKDLKEKHDSTTTSHKNCDEAEEKTSSPSSYIARLESKYKPGYIVDEDEGKSSFPSSYMARLESKYKPGYVVDEADEQKGSSPLSHIADLERKYQPDYGVVEDGEKSSSPSSYIVRLESKYKQGYVVDETEENSSSFIAGLESKHKPGYVVEERSSFPSSYAIARLESKYRPGYVVDEAEEKDSSPSSYIARLETKYQPGYGAYGVIEADEEKTSSPSSYIARVESKYKPGYVVDEAEEKNSSPSYIARLESKYQPGYGAYGVTEADEKKTSSPSSYIARVESKYKPGYVVDEAEEKNSSPSSYIARLESKYQPGYGAYGVIEADEKKASSPSSYIAHVESKYKPGYAVDEDVNGVEEKKSPQPSSKTMKHDHNMENHGHDDIGSEDVGVFTVDDVLSFYAGRELSTFFSIRNHSLYPGFLPREVADSIPFSSSESLKILQFFSVSPDSPKGKTVKDTLRRCEIEAAKGEIKICATSSESMLEFLRNAFAPEADFKFITTTHPTMTTPILQSYTVLEPPREIKSPKTVACHPFPYLYSIYMCHFDATETKVFKVPLVGDNGDKVDALIVCHMDTSAWSPKHVAFSLLGTNPGIPVCHAFSEGHGVWIQTSPTAAM